MIIICIDLFFHLVYTRNIRKIFLVINNKWEVVYVTAKRNIIINTYQTLSQKYHLDFSINPSVLSPDNSTLFTTSGMQHYKHLYSDIHYHNTFTNIQKCLRLNDLDEIGDGTHYLTFEMIGFYSFREYTLKQSIDFMLEFLNKLNITPDYVTIHPDKYDEWKHLYDNYNVEIRKDSECVWSDGNIGGYCTEFYKNNIEIGNIVNTLDTCIDIGFGLERLIQVSSENTLSSLTRLDILEDTILTLINSNIKIGHYKEEFILKKLITESVFLGSQINHEYFKTVKSNMVKNYTNYLRNKDKLKYKDKEKDFWLNTFGIYTDKIDFYHTLYTQETS